jgi:hypothetical protein
MSRLNKIVKTIDFIEYISKDMEREDLLLLYRINNVGRERLEMFSDFIFSLNDLIITTYMGDDVTLGEYRIKHFKWCWDKVISDFKKEGIYFINTKELYNYFLNFYQESFYEEEKDQDKINSTSIFWDNLMSFGNNKTMSEYETMLEIYRLFNKSFVVN